MTNILKSIKAAHARLVSGHGRFHKVTAHGEHWIHAIYCGALYIEGHGLYAVIGGVLGLVVILNIIIGAGD